MYRGGGGEIYRVQAEPLCADGRGPWGGLSWKEFP